MNCKDNRPDFHGVIGEDDKNRKNKIEKLTIKALGKLYTKMREITNWKKERGDLEKKIVRLEYALQATKRHPKAVSDSESLIEKYFVNCVSKGIRTIDDLVCRLVSVIEKNEYFHNRNVMLEFEIDQLKTMIRISSGNSAEYRERVNELQNIVVQVDRETGILKRSIEDVKSDENITMYQNSIKRVEISMNELMMKLKNDREAILAAEKSRYEISELTIRTKSLLQQLERTAAELRARSCGIECPDKLEYPKAIKSIEVFVKSVASDLNSLKSVPMSIGTRIGNESSVQYLKRIRTLEKFVAGSLSIIDKLIINSEEVSRQRTEQDVEHVRVFSSSRDSIEDLVVLAKKLNAGMKELKISVAAGDSENLIQRNRELERSLKKLKNELSTKDEEYSSLRLELTGRKIACCEKSEALEKLQRKYERMASRMKKRGIDMDKEDRTIENLLREIECSKLEAAEMKNLRLQVNELTTQVTNLQNERATFVEETNRMNMSIKEKNQQLANISEQKESLEKSLSNEINETRKNLAEARKEIKSLEQDNSKIKNDLESALKQPERMDAIIDCQINTAEAEELSRIKIQYEKLIVDLNSEKSTTIEILQNYDKLMNDFQLLNTDFENLTIERSCIRKNLEDSEREKNAAIIELDKLRQEKFVFSNESLNLKMQLNMLTRDLDEAKAKNRQIDEQLNKLNEEAVVRSIRLETLMKDNEDLNNKLDSARSDKLNLAGSLNDWRFKYEESNDQLNTKIRQVNDLQERLRCTLDNLEEAKTIEASANLEVARLLDLNASLRKTIDASSTAKASLENSLESLDNKYRSMKNELVQSVNENKTLKEDSSLLNKEIDKFIKNLKNLTMNEERITCETSHCETTEILDKQGDGEFKIVFEILRIELTRLRNENSSLKSECERMTSERKKINELYRVGAENDSMKVERTKLKIANAEVEKIHKASAKNEHEKLCSEIVALRAENCAMAILVKKMRATNVKLVEQRDSLKISNVTLAKDLEEAKNEITRSDEETRKSKITIAELKDTLEKLLERHRIAMKHVEEMRSQYENLNKEFSVMKKSLESTKSVDQALRQELDVLRSILKRVNDDNSQRRMDFAETEKELLALKDELSKARATNEELRTELDTKYTEYHRLEDANAILKDELEELKHSRILADEERNELRAEYEKLKVLKVKLEEKLTDAVKDIGKYTVATAKLNGLENKLKGVLKDYVVTKKLLRSANEEVNHLRHLAEPCARCLGYGEIISAI